MGSFGRDKEIARVLVLTRSSRKPALTVHRGHGSGKTSLPAEIPNSYEGRTALPRSRPLHPLIAAEQQEYGVEESAAVLGQK